MSTATNDWQDFFESWPSQMARRGTLVVSFGDQIPFCSFLTKGGLLLIQRNSPDSVGARQLILSYSDIVALKIVEVTTGDVFSEAGFAGELAVV
jgi:hypothetical protein